MEQLHFITKLLELTDPKLWIPSIGIHIRKLSLNWTTTPHLALIAEVKWRNITFKNILRFLTSKRLVCLPEFYLESVVLSAINARKWWCLKLLSSRKITKSPVSSTKKLLKSWLKRLLWPILPISWLFQLQLSFEITFLNMIDPSDVEWKSLLWICLALTMTWLNSFFRVLKSF